MRTSILISLVTLLFFVSGPAEASIEDSKLTVSLGAGGIWYLANFSFIGMRAQASTAVGWKIAAFIFGFPGTLLTYLVVRKGSERAYGVELPRRKSHEQPAPQGQS